MNETLMDICQVASVFETKLTCLEGKGGVIVDEGEDYVEMVFPDGTGCILTYLGRVDWHKAT